MFILIENIDTIDTYLRGYVSIVSMSTTSYGSNQLHSQNMPIVKLKECIEECTGVPTHQQRLTIGDSIVEDWDEEHRMMFIGDYPKIQHGSLLYLIQLDGGYRMKVQCGGSQLQLIKNGPVSYQYRTRYYYFNSIKVRVILICMLVSSVKFYIVTDRIVVIHNKFGVNCHLSQN